MRRAANFVTLMLVMAVLLGALALRMSSVSGGASTRTWVPSSPGQHDQVPGRAMTSDAASLDEADSDDGDARDTDVLATTLTFAPGATHRASLTPDAPDYASPFAERATRPPRA